MIKETSLFYIDTIDVVAAYTAPEHSEHFGSQAL